MLPEQCALQLYTPFLKIYQDDSGSQAKIREHFWLHRAAVSCVQDLVLVEGAVYREIRGLEIDSS
jgi:hypothetical protein